MGEGEGGIEAAEWRPSSSSSPICESPVSFSSRLWASQFRRFVGLDEEQVQEQLQGAGGLQSGRSKGELAARWLDRIET
ncbi:hypothetical protein V8C26DRAFT_119822 [Trichoderma gracile]